jgi:hypothetical protein
VIFVAEKFYSIGPGFVEGSGWLGRMGFKERQTRRDKTLKYKQKSLQRNNDDHDDHNDSGKMMDEDENYKKDS